MEPFIIKDLKHAEGGYEAGVCPLGYDFTDDGSYLPLQFLTKRGMWLAWQRWACDTS